MDIKVLEKADHKLVFVVEDISIEIANAIRRIIISEIPVMGVDEVIVLKNDSPLYDEIIAHRLGMIPLLLIWIHISYHKIVSVVASDVHFAKFHLHVKL